MAGVISTLDPTAEEFTHKNQDLVHRGVLVPDLNLDWEVVQSAHMGEVRMASSIDRVLGKRFEWKKVRVSKIICSNYFCG